MKHHDDESEIEEEEVTYEEMENDESDNEESDDEIQNSSRNNTHLIWSIMGRESARTGSSLSEVYKSEVLFSRALKKDRTHQAIIKTLRNYQEEDDMDFLEALSLAIDKRRFLFKRHKSNLHDNDGDE